MPKSALGLPASQVTPEPSLEKRTRRRFMADYKLHILAEADACQHGELGALLRREKLYSNQLCAWRREYGEHGGERRTSRATSGTTSCHPPATGLGSQRSVELGYHQAALGAPGYLSIAVCGAGPVQSFCSGLDAAALQMPLECFAKLYNQPESQPAWPATPP